MTEIPEPIVVKYVLGTFKTRRGRGFSEAELKETGISTTEAKRLSIRIDPRRRTKLDENVKTLKAWLKGRSKHRSDKKGRRSTPRRSG